MLLGHAAGSLEDTIVGAATAYGPGLRAILRITGPSAHSALRAVLADDDSPSDWSDPLAWETRVLVWGRPIPVLIFVWPAGRSATGQPTAELHVPACPPLLDAVQDALRQTGVRLARPGEFTLRAFLSGRIDLAQAEGVLGLVSARSEVALKDALDQRAGGVSKPVTALRDELLDLLADLEAGLDFVEEDITFVSAAAARERLHAARDAAAALASQLAGRVVRRDRPTVALVGRPNAGKSTLLNALLGRSAALVSERPGSTRDYVEGELTVGDTIMSLIDTAGLELASADPFHHDIDHQRAMIVSQADFVLRCAPPGEPWPDWEAPSAARVRTMIDRADRNVADDAEVSVSALHGIGLEELKHWLADRIRERETSVTPLAARASGEVANAAAALDAALAALEDGDELVCMALREAINALGAIVGVVHTDDLLGRIFSRFCIGK